ncbi:MAG: hypothetical protein ACRYGR_06450 [Janthinobacterium lividum]
MSNSEHEAGSLFTLDQAISTLVSIKLQVKQDRVRVLQKFKYELCRCNKTETQVELTIRDIANELWGTDAWEIIEEVESNNNK